MSQFDSNRSSRNTLKQSATRRLAGTTESKKPARKGLSSDSRVPLNPGTEIEGYVIHKVIGQGSFSLVYSAKELRLNRDVVIKEYFPKHFSQRMSNNNIIPLDGKRLFTFREGFSQFFNEAMALNKIAHPNVLKTHNVFRYNRTAYLVSDNVGGRDLRWFLTSVSESMNINLIFKVFMPILSALNFLHEAQLLHLDIKPANILLQPNGEALLLDFGAAQTITSDKRINRMQTLTHGFAPPEQYDRKQKLGPWTDIYAVAATLYYGIACKPPVKSKDNKLQTKLNYSLYKHLYSENLIDAVNRALSYDLESRYDNVDSFAEHLLAGSKWKTLREYELDAMQQDRFAEDTRQAQNELAAAVA